jgi:capsular polysaccharide biosynthesis protein
MGYIKFMNKTNYLNLIKNSWKAVALFTAILVLLTIIVSLIQPFEYRSRTGFLVVQKQNQGLDAYAAAKASERLAVNFAEIIKTDSFYQKVISSGFRFNIELPEKENARRKAWEKMVATQVASESGIMTVDVFYKDKTQAEIVSRAIASVLINDSAEYHGGGSSVVIKMVNTPLVSNYPVRPNIILNVFSALILGLILSSGYVIYKEYSKISDQNLNSDVIEIQKEKSNEGFQQEDTDFDPEMEQAPIKTMLSEPFGKKYYFED